MKYYPPPIFPKLLNIKIDQSFLYKRCLSIFMLLCSVILLNSCSGGWLEIGNKYMQEGKYKEAEYAYKKEIEEWSCPSCETLTSLSFPYNNISYAYLKQGKYKEAEEAAIKALNIRINNLGKEHKYVGSSWHNLGNSYECQGKYLEAENSLKKAYNIAISPNIHDDVHIAEILNDLGLVYFDEGDFSKAEKFLKEAIEIKVKNLGGSDRNTISSWGNLAIVYSNQGRYAEAEEVEKRSYNLLINSLGLNHPDITYSLANLGIIYQKQGKFAEAEQTLKYALETNIRTLGLDNPRTVGSIESLGILYEKMGRYADAGENLKKSLRLMLDILGKDHPDTAHNWNSLGNVYEKEGMYADAEASLRKALAIYIKILGTNHPTTAETKADLAETLLSENTQDKTVLALEYAGEAGKAIYNRFAGSNTTHRDKYEREQNIHQNIHLIHLKALSQAQAISGINPKIALSESLVALQRSQNSIVAKDIAKMVGRIASGDNEVSKLAYQRKELIDQLTSAEKQLMEAYSEGHPDIAENHKNRISKLNEELSEVDKRISIKFPKYTELANPKPATLSEIQRALNNDEALVAVTFDNKQGYLWVIRDNNAMWWTIPVMKKTIDREVSILRAATDPYLLEKCRDLPDFQVQTARHLYNVLFAPSEQLLKGAKTLFVVDDGALQSIPFEMLIHGGEENDSLQDLNWLTKEYAFAYLPSVSSFKILRNLGTKSTAPAPFIGFGDPVLYGNSKKVIARSIFDEKRSGLANIKGIRELLPLPETADELRTLAQTLGASGQSLYLKQKATEKNLKNIDLSHYIVLAFATHGLIAGDFDFLGEPALVLTPPDIATEEDDGLLTASEVTNLKLNADFVVLSACNTASSDGTPGAEGFSGLAKAFFYAGAKTLLVSHWPVISDSAKRLTTSMFKTIQINPQIQKAEALRRAKLELINDSKQPYLAHPIFWAPFVMVGKS